MKEIDPVGVEERRSRRLKRKDDPLKGSQYFVAYRWYLRYGIYCDYEVKNKYPLYATKHWLPLSGTSFSSTVEISSLVLLNHPLPWRYLSSLTQEILDVSWVFSHRCGTFEVLLHLLYFFFSATHLSQILS